LAEYVRIGGLISYSSDNEERYRRIAGYIDRIFRGEDPSNLPFYQPTNFLLTISLRVAKALRLTIPPTLLGRADEVIE
jgi:putative ABC transport system substrate-binding protein